MSSGRTESWKPLAERLRNLGYFVRETPEGLSIGATRFHLPIGVHGSPADPRVHVRRGPVFPERVMHQLAVGWIPFATLYGAWQLMAFADEAVSNLSLILLLLLLALVPLGLTAVVRAVHVEGMLQNVRAEAYEARDATRGAVRAT